MEHTARGKDISPEIQVSDVDEGTVTMAVTLDDASHPIFKNYNHWLIWNLPISQVVPQAMPKGESLADLNGAMQGLAYGRHCYKGPKPPLKFIHFYTFTVYTLDTRLELPAKSTRADFFKAAQGHILQKAAYTGKFQSRRTEAANP